MPQTYRVKLSGPGISVEREITESLAQQIVVLSMGNTGKPAVEPAQRGAEGIPNVPPARAQGQELAIAEYFNDRQPKRAPDKITVIAVYLKNFCSKQVFTIPDLKKGFEDAAETVPGNIARDVNWAKKLGWIAPKTGQRGTYYITASGADAVERKFPPEMLKKSRLSRPKKKSGK